MRQAALIDKQPWRGMAVYCRGIAAHGARLLPRTLLLHIDAMGELTLNLFGYV